MPHNTDLLLWNGNNFVVDRITWDNGNKEWVFSKETKVYAWLNTFGKELEMDYNTIVNLLNHTGLAMEDCGWVVLSKYDIHQDGYYTVVTLPEDEFYKIPQELIIEPYEEGVKYMLGNTEEEEYLEGIGAFVGEGHDYFKVVREEPTQFFRKTMAG